RHTPLPSRAERPDPEWEQTPSCHFRSEPIAPTAGARTTPTALAPSNTPKSRAHHGWSCHYLDQPSASRLPMAEIETCEKRRRSILDRSPCACATTSYPVIPPNAAPATTSLGQCCRS